MKRKRPYRHPMPPPARPVTPMKIDEAAEAVLDWIRSRDPIYAARIDPLITEQRLTAKQIIGRMCGYVLDHSLHNECGADKMFADDAVPVAPMIDCPQCGKHFRTLFPGQQWCSLACTEAARRPSSTKDETQLPFEDPQPTEVTTEVRG